MEARIFRLFLVAAVERGIKLSEISSNKPESEDEPDSSLLVVLPTPSHVEAHISGFNIKDTNYMREQKAINLKSQGKFKEAEDLYR